MSVATGASVAESLQLEPFVVELERFQGPLDLLLHLIRSQDIDIFDIPIAHITKQFRKAIESGLEGMPLERAGEFIEMAATLVRVKAQMLLPRSTLPEWEEDPRAELVRRLLEYEHFRDVVHVLEAAEAERARHYPKGYIGPRPPPRDALPELELDLDEFLYAAARIPEPLPPPVVVPPSRSVSVGQKVSLLRKLMRGAKRLAFERLFAPWGTRPHAVAAFLACLELARQHVIRIEQVGSFGSIWLLPGRGTSRAAEEKPE